MTEFRKLTLADALAVVAGMRQWDRRGMAAMLGDVSDDDIAIGRVQTHGPAWSMHVGDRPVAIGGVSLPNAWAGTFWLLATDDLAGQSWGKLLRQTRTVLSNITNPLHEEYRHRVEAWTIEGWRGAERLVERLGFRHESLRQCVGAGGESFNVWAITGPVKDTGMTTGYVGAGGQWVSVADQPGGLPRDGDTYNSAATLNALRVALMQAASGSGRVKMAVMGDSTTTNSFGLYKTAWLARLIKEMGALPEMAPPGATYPGWQDNSFFGNLNMGGTPAATYQPFDPRLAFGAGGWVNTQACDPFGYQFTFTGASFNNAGATLSFTPENSIDSFTVWHGGRSGSYSVNVDGGAALTVASGQSAGLTTVAIPASIASFAAGNSTFTVPAGAHTINVVVQSGSTTDIRGVNAWTSTASYLDVMRMSSNGATLAQINTSNNFFDGGKWWPFNYAPDITLVRMTTNELAAYIVGGRLQSYITAYLSRLDTILANRNGSKLVMAAGPWYGPAATVMGGSIFDNPLLSALVAWCQLNSVPFFDLFSQWGFGSSAGAVNLIGGDSTHPSNAGHLAEAVVWKKKLTQLLG